MGIFGNLKKILFEDDDEDEVSSMPTYTKEDIVETSRDVEVEPESTKVEEPIKTSDNTRFSNVKRDIDFYDEKDVLGDISEVANKVVEEKVAEVPVKKEEKKSVFPSFDEEEFERLNSRITKNENRFRKEVNQSTNVNVNTDARRANSNFSATSMSVDNRSDNVDRYKLNNSGTVKKTFTPSPIISPVYGILDKNYSKEDIVDKKGGIKRERVVKPVVKKEKVEVPEVVTIEQAESTNVAVDIDSVRKKAYGGLEELEKSLVTAEMKLDKEKIENIEIPELKKVEVVVEEPIVEEKEEVEVVVSEPVVVAKPVEEEISVEDQLDEEFVVDVKNVEEIVEEDSEENNVELDKVVEDVIEKKKEAPVTTKSNPKILDDLEKTSTLQILDDIEKELNSIKPISKDTAVTLDDEEDIKNSSDTLEKDLFNLIDSMYVEGEEEEDD